MSELPDGILPAVEPEPRPSASGIVLRRGADRRWRVLMGLRARTARFMPGNLVFPGGAVDVADRAAGDGVWAACASRELREETGVEMPEGRWVDAGERVTPPLWPVRFRNRFLVAPALAETPATIVPPSPDEIERIDWADPAEVVAGWERGRHQVAPPVLPILRTLAAAATLELGFAADAIAETNAAEERTPRIEFLAGIWVLPVRSATLPPATHTNVWIAGGRRLAVIDPGADAPAEVERLLAVIERRRALGAEPAAVLLTHHHRDHVAGAVVVARALGVPILAHPRTLERLASIAGGAPPATRAIEDGERVDLEGAALRALFTPGHAPGHLAFEVEGRGAILSGDLISGLSTILIDPAEGDMGAYLASLERLAGSGAGVLLPGHGPPLPMRAVERLAAHRRAREQAVLGALGAGRAALDEIAAAAYADSAGLPAALIERQTLAHLVELERRGLARRHGVAQWRGA